MSEYMTQSRCKSPDEAISLTDKTAKKCLRSMFKELPYFRDVGHQDEVMADFNKYFTFNEAYQKPFSIKSPDHSLNSQTGLMDVMS